MPTRSNHHLRFRGSLLGFIMLIGLGSRLYFKDSNVFFFDGDEAIVGLMALDVLDGSFPIYFYGQNYGMSIVEACFIALGVIFWGTSMLAIKLPMLAMWLCSIYILGLVFEELLGHKKWWAFLFVTIILLSPTWLVWSMKARGGYLSSFFLSTLIVYFLVRSKYTLSKPEWFVLGGLLVILYELQPLWLPGTLAVVFFTMLRSIDFKKLGFCVFGALSTVVVFIIIKSDIATIWASPGLNLTNLHLAVVQLPVTLFNSLRGDYFLEVSYDTDSYAYPASYLLLFIVSIGFFIFYSKGHKAINSSTAFLMAALFSMVGVLIRPDAPRYLLPFFGFSLLFIVDVFAYTSQIKYQRAMVLLGLIVGIIGLSYLSRFTSYSFVNLAVNKKDQTISNDQHLMLKLLDKIEAHDIKYVLCTNDFLQYQINYLSNRRITAVGYKATCRTPWNLDTVWKAHAEETDRFALLGYNLGGKYPDKRHLILDKFIYVMNPSMQTLARLGFVKDAIDVLNIPVDEEHG